MDFNGWIARYHRKRVKITEMFPVLKFRNLAAGGGVARRILLSKKGFGISPSLQATSNSNSKMIPLINQASEHHHQHENHHVSWARGSAEILNIARSARPQWILRSRDRQKSISEAKSLFFENRAMHANNVCDVMSCNAISKIHHHVDELRPAQTFDNEFSGSPRLHHAKLHDLNWGLSKENSNLMVRS